jgi:hypothetical protein
VVEVLRHLDHPRIIGADLDRDRALARSRREELRVDALGDERAEAEPVEPGAGQDQRIGLARIEPAQARVDIAMQRVDLHVRTSSEQEAGPPWAVGADPGARRQGIQLGRFAPTHEQPIARVRPLEIGDNPQS